MQPSRYLSSAVVLLALASAAGCAATPEARWYQQREALNTANEVYLANLPLMSDEQIVHHGELLQAARASLEQARIHLPEGGPTFDTALNVVEAVLMRPAVQDDPATTHAPVTEDTPDERH